MEASGTWSSRRPLRRRSLLPLFATWRWLESARDVLAWRSWRKALGACHLYADVYTLSGGRPDDQPSGRRRHSFVGFGRPARSAACKKQRRGELAAAFAKPLITLVTDLG